MAVHRLAHPAFRLVPRADVYRRAAHHSLQWMSHHLAEAVPFLVPLLWLATWVLLIWMAASTRGWL